MLTLLRRHALTLLGAAAALAALLYGVGLVAPFIGYWRVDLLMLISAFAMGVVELVIVVVEGLAYWYFGGLIGWRAALTSLAANAVSFPVGWNAEIAHLNAHYMAGRAIPWWVHPLTFAVAIVVEVAMVLLINLRFRHRRELVRVAVVVNIITCLLLLNALGGFAHTWVPVIHGY